MFRPQLNAERLIRSCQAVSLEPPPESLFMEALERVIQDNADYVPPFGSDGSLYIRPFVIGSGAQIGLSPSPETSFYIFVNPVGNCYKGGIGSPVKALIQHGFDRAAPSGTGHVKLGGNYAPCLGPSLAAKKKGYTITLFLDPKESKYIEEFSSSNFAALTASDAQGKRTYVTPKSKSILPSVTNRSLVELARRHFGWRVERRDVTWEEVKKGGFEEIVACGTAAVITPIGQIDREVPVFLNESQRTEKKAHIATLSDAEVEQDFWMDDSPKPTEFEIDSVPISQSLDGFKELYDVYRALQNGELKGWESYGWMWPSEGF